MAEFMATDERFLVDLDEVVCVLRRIVEEEAGAVFWANMGEQMLVRMLDSLFYGSLLSGERLMEQMFKERGASELAAIKGSRLAYTTLVRCLGLEQAEQLGTGFFEYQLLPEINALLVFRVEMDLGARSVRARVNDTDLYLLELEQSIDAGDYVPERLRRIVTERRKAS